MIRNIQPLSINFDFLKPAISTFLSDKFSPVPLERMVRFILGEIRNHRFMGIPGSLFYVPEPTDPFRMERYGKMLETPLGLAAGPHTQLAMNIVAGWLCGARYIELKTVQTLDDLKIPKPCIDMNDEGYNSEWSQELSLDQSFQEYLKAWIIIHILHREMGYKGSPGIIFNMSLGYNLEGILKENVQRFLDRMRDCRDELDSAKRFIRKIYPPVDELDIPGSISNNVTLSTMHGCPSGEVGKIGLYFLGDRKLHTTIKLNPTLLGPEAIRGLLNRKLEFSAEIPDEVFDHDLKYQDAQQIIRSLMTATSANGLQFSVKLTNTLACRNSGNVLSSEGEMVYMSGRALHPVSINLARKLQNDFNGELDISFSAGVDCFNMPDVLACGLRPVTVCSDLLKPGGYGRLWQTIDRLRKDFREKKVNDISQYILKTAGTPGKTVADAALINLNRYANRVTEDPAYKKSDLAGSGTRTDRPLDYFDCIHAPCIDGCPANQDIPGYLGSTIKGDFRTAFRIVFDTNPFPSVTGMICDHPCQMKCTRIHYDEAVRIREIKRFVAMTPPPSPPLEGEGRRGGVSLKAAVIGAGPAGLSCAWFLNQAGFEVHIFEQKSLAGGMISAAIPSFRLTREVIERDIRRILDSGIRLHDNHPVNKENFNAIRSGHDVVFLAIGAQRSAELELEGIDAEGVIDGLEFLVTVREKKPAWEGRQVVVIGGGNTAMDVARTAIRLVGTGGKVTLVYRRTIREMPADKGEISSVRDEGIEILELASPERIIKSHDHVTTLVCCRNILSIKGKDGRPCPIKIAGSEFEIPCDTIIPTIGQQRVIDFLDPEMLKISPGSYQTQIKGIYIGGDAMRGASTAIHAIGDGRKAAEEIISGFMGSEVLKKFFPVPNTVLNDLMHNKALRQRSVTPAETLPNQRFNFDPVILPLSPDEAQTEASRCLHCDEICNVCVSVCPNLANFCYQVEPVSYHLQKAVLGNDGTIGFEEDRVFNICQSWQILNIRDLCNECGNCVTFCPTSGRPFAEKPGLCLSVQTLNLEGEGYLLSRLQDRDVLIYKKDETIKTLTLASGNYIFETDQVTATFGMEDFRLKDVSFLTPCVRQFYFHFAAEMSIILQGARQLHL